jgi:hypothetical protein
VICSVLFEVAQRSRGPSAAEVITSPFLISGVHRCVDRAEEKGRDDSASLRLLDLGRNATPAPPRWSIIRNVLHRVE